jgi:hypothetical protein
MPITDVIREADSAHEIYFLLTAYVEAVRHCDPLQHLPGFITELPFTGFADVQMRAERMRSLLESPAGADAMIRAVLAEALGILTVAGERLEALRAGNASPLLEAA